MSVTEASTRNAEARLVDFGSDGFDAMPCCGIKNPAHPGRRRKQCWLAANVQFGVRARTLVAPDGQPAGYIEYLPGEFAWRGVEACNYMFIHCAWIYSRRYQRKGWGGFMLDACVEDAKRAGMRGVAVMVRSGPWLADRRLFLANGFELADTAPPDYELLVRKVDRRSADPVLRKGQDQNLQRYGHGLTIIQSSQCPHITKFAADIAVAANDEYGLKANVIDLQSYSDAQSGPTPYATFAVIYEGRLLTDHQISCTRFRNIMQKIIR